MDNMGTTSTELPPMDKISMIGIWIETVLYGVNCVMYVLCMFILLYGGRTATLYRVLIVVITILFLLCTVHVGASLQQLLDAFIYVPTGVPDYSTVYWLDYTTTLRVLKDNVYGTLVLAEAFIFIWRLYVVFMYDWRVVVFPIILAAGSVGSAFAASAVSVSPNNGMYGSLTTSLIISGWAVGFVFNLSVTGAIVARLWWMGRSMASLTATSESTNRFASSIYIVVESGAISAVCSTVALALFASSNPASLTSLDILSQVAVLIPLLVVVQVWKNGRCPKGDTSIPLTEGEIRFRAGVPPEHDSQQDLAPDTSLARSPSST